MALGCVTDSRCFGSFGCWDVFCFVCFLSKRNMSRISSCNLLLAGACALVELWWALFDSHREHADFWH